MRTALLAAALLACGLSLVPTPPAAAQQIRVGSSGSDTTTRIVPRMSLRDAQHAIVSRDGRVALLLSERGVVMQLTDRGLEKVTAPEPAREESGFLAEMISSMVRGGVRTMLNRGIEHAYHDLKDARYENGRLHFVRVDGERIFQDVEVDGVQVMESFSERDARGFVARFREAKARDVAARR